MDLIKITQMFTELNRRRFTLSDIDVTRQSHAGCTHAVLLIAI